MEPTWNRALLQGESTPRKMETAKIVYFKLATGYQISKRTLRKLMSE
jgi:hypothetical protein